MARPLSSHMSRISTRSALLPVSSHCLRKYSYRLSTRAPSVTTALAISPLSTDMNCPYSERFMRRTAHITPSTASSYALFCVTRLSAWNSNCTLPSSAIVDAPPDQAGLYI